MQFVSSERLELVEKWDKAPIRLSASQMVELEDIGCTPPDVYGNGVQFQETPCLVVTKDGETIDLAVVSLQRHAPIEQWRPYRLASDIEEIRLSPFALPLAVRRATARAEEIRMGFSPTLVILPSGEELALNGTNHFLVWNGCDASRVQLSHRGFDMRTPDKVYGGHSGVVYFVADA